MSLQNILEKYYAEEINVQLNSFWDGGWTIEIGDISNGFVYSKNLDSLSDVTTWLEQAFPIVNDTKSLPEVKALYAKKYNDKENKDNYLKEINHVFAKKLRHLNDLYEFNEF